MLLSTIVITIVMLLSTIVITIVMLLSHYSYNYSYVTKSL